MRITRASYGATLNDAGALNRRVFYGRESSKKRVVGDSGEEFCGEICDARDA